MSILSKGWHERVPRGWLSHSSAGLREKLQAIWPHFEALLQPMHQFSV